MGINDITGDALRSKPPTDAFRDNFERIFGVAKCGPDSLGDQNVSDAAGNTDADRVSVPVASDPVA